jgi:hypothetical protein
VLGAQDTSSLLSLAAVDETEFCRSQPGCFGFSLQGNTTEKGRMVKTGAGLLDYNVDCWAGRALAAAMLASWPWLLAATSATCRRSRRADVLATPIPPRGPGGRRPRHPAADAAGANSSSTHAGAGRGLPGYDTYLSRCHSPLLVQSLHTYSCMIALCTHRKF